MLLTIWKLNIPNVTLPLRDYCDQVITTLLQKCFLQKHDVELCFSYIYIYIYIDIDIDI